MTHILPEVCADEGMPGLNVLILSDGRAGHLNPQTTWVLNHLGIELPTLLTDASPRFSVISHRLNTASPEHPLREVWSIANRTGGVAPIVDSEGKPFGLVTVISLFDFLSRTVGAHPRREEMRIGSQFGQNFHRSLVQGVQFSIEKGIIERSDADHL